MQHVNEEDIIQHYIGSPNSAAPSEEHLNLMSCMSIAHTVATASLWRTYAQDYKQHPLAPLKLHVDILASYPTQPEQHMRMAVMCATAESLELAHDAYKSNCLCTHDRLDRRKNTPRTIDAPSHMYFIQALYTGNDRQLAHAVQWLFGRLFKTKIIHQTLTPLSRLSSIPIYLQQEDDALRMVRLLPMMLKAIHENEQIRARILLDELQRPFLHADQCVGYHNKKRFGGTLHVEEQSPLTPTEIHLIDATTNEREIAQAMDVDLSTNKRLDMLYCHLRLKSDTLCNESEKHAFTATNMDVEEDADNVQFDDEPQSMMMPQSLESSPVVSKAPMPTIEENIEEVTHGDKPQLSDKRHKICRLYRCPLYSNILALIAPNAVRTCIATITLRRVWSTILSDYNLWVKHRLLACVLIEHMQALDFELRPFNSQVKRLPTWFIWRKMRKRYVEWRRERQPMHCPSIRDSRIRCYRAQATPGSLMQERMNRYKEAVGKASTRDEVQTQDKENKQRVAHWCHCAQCSHVSCTRALPQWYAESSSTCPSSAPITPGFWNIKCGFRSIEKLLTYIDKNIYVEVSNYAQGPAVSSGAYQSPEEDPYQKHYVVYDPLCSIPPYPTCPEERVEWQNADGWIPIGMKSGKTELKYFNCPEYTELNSYSNLLPNLGPSHLLFYTFACDPAIDDDLRSEIFINIQAVQSLWRNQFYLNEEVESDNHDLFDVFRTSSEINVQWMHHYAAKEQLDVQLGKTATSDSCTLQWMTDNMPPLTYDQILEDRCMPMQAIAALATMVDALNFLPHGIQTQESNATFADLPLTRTTVSYETLAPLFNENLLRHCLAHQSRLRRSWPLGWLKSPFQDTMPEQMPCDEVLDTMQDWLAPMALYSHDTMPVYDSRFVAHNTGTNCKKTKKTLCYIVHETVEPGPFSLCAPNAPQCVLQNPPMRIAVHNNSMHRLYSSLSRRSTALYLNVLEQEQLREEHDASAILDRRTTTVRTVRPTSTVRTLSSSEPPSAGSPYVPGHLSLTPTAFHGPSNTINRHSIGDNVVMHHTIRAQMYIPDRFLAATTQSSTPETFISQALRNSLLRTI